MIPSTQTLNTLSEMATSKLEEIARVVNRGDYEESEFLAVKKLLDNNTTSVSK